MSLAIICHGGAGTIPRALRAAHQSGIQQAVVAGKRVLESDGSALEAVIASITIMEDLDCFNAGLGAVLNAEGRAELDAGLMEGQFLKIGSVAAVADVPNPIQLCRVVLEGPNMFFSGAVASRLAAIAGVPKIHPSNLISVSRLRQWKQQRAGPRLDAGLTADTVGAVALDKSGLIVAGTSTGGISGKPPGRIGDSPLPGGGFYADNEVGGSSSTGWGEALASIAAARRSVEGLEIGLNPGEAAQRTIDFLERRIPGAEGGVIVLDREGRVGTSFNSAAMTFAWWSQAEETGPELVVRVADKSGKE